MTADHIRLNRIYQRTCQPRPYVELREFQQIAHLDRGSGNKPAPLIIFKNLAGTTVGLKTRQLRRMLRLATHDQKHNRRTAEATRFLAMVPQAIARWPQKPE